MNMTSAKCQFWIDNWTHDRKKNTKIETTPKKKEWQQKNRPLESRNCPPDNHSGPLVKLGPYTRIKKLITCWQSINQFELLWSQSKGVFNRVSYKKVTIELWSQLKWIYRNLKNREMISYNIHRSDLVIEYPRVNFTVSKNTKIKAFGQNTNYSQDKEYKKNQELVKKQRSANIFNLIASNGYSHQNTE